MIMKQFQHPLNIIIEFPVGADSGMHEPNSTHTLIHDVIPSQEII